MFSRQVRPFSLFLMFFVVVAVCALAAGLGNSAEGQPPLPRADEPRPDTAKITYLPVLLRRSPTRGIFGTETGSFYDTAVLDRLVNAGSYWLRRAGIWWPDVQPTVDFNWEPLRGFDIELANAGSRGLHVILVVRGTPYWAQAASPWLCGPIRSDQFQAFANFLSILVNRYSQPPYNVKYWEIWNEPDIDRQVPYMPYDCPWGCWGEVNDPYYGGSYYAQMLKVVYPAIKAADKEAQVLLGGLLLDCDPRDPPPGKGTCRPSLFLEGILRGGGGPYFDGISFHAYDYYYGELGRYANSNWHSAWNTTGPVSIAKADFIEDTLAAYGVTDKYLINTESALLCETCGEDDVTFETTKAYYLAQVYATALVQGLRGNLWYSLYGWNNSGLLKADGTPQPAFVAYGVASQKLRYVSFVRKIDEYPGVTGYEFAGEEGRLWLLWSRDGLPHAINLPGTPTSVQDALGYSEPVGGAYLTVTVEPLWVSWG